MATPFDKTTNSTTDVKVTKDAVAKAAPAQVAVNLKVFNWYGQRCEVGKLETRVYPAWQDGVPDKPYKYEFTFLQGAVVSPFGEPVALNLLQYASPTTGERIFAKMQKALPDTLLKKAVLGFTNGSPYQTTIPQAIIQIPGLDPWNVAALACKIIFYDWQFFLNWLKTTLEPQGIRVDTTITDEGL